MSMTNRLIRNLDALEQAVNDICDPETVKRIIARKHEIQKKKGGDK